MQTDAATREPSGPNGRGRSVVVLRALAGLGVLLAFVLLQNLFGRPVNELMLRAPGIDKALHFVEYAGLFAAIHWLAGRAGVGGGVRPVGSGAVALLMAIVDEMAQQFGPARSVEALDVAADASGIAFAWVVIGSAAPGLRRLAVAALALACGAYVTFDSHVRTRDFARGLLYERQHDFQSARVHYLRALEAGLRTPALYNSLGWVEIESGIGDAARAVEYARLALDMRPDDPDIHDTYGWALHHVGRNLEALDYLKRALAAKPRIFCIHYHLGAVYRALGRLDLAQSHFRRQAELAGTREAALAIRALNDMTAGPQ